MDDHGDNSLDKVNAFSVGVFTCSIANQSYFNFSESNTERESDTSEV